MYAEKPPSDDILEAYYQAWKKGRQADSILRFLQLKFGKSKVSPERYTKWMPFFFAYTKEQSKKDLIGGTLKMTKTPALEDRFIKYARTGMPFDKIAKIMNIPIPTLFSQWFLDENFKRRVDYAELEAITEVEEALHKRATGYDKKLKSKTNTTTQGATGTSTTDMESERTEHVQGSVEAMKVFLYNRAPSRWSPEGNPNKEGSMGAILERMDEMTELTPEDKAELERRGVKS